MSRGRKEPGALPSTVIFDKIRWASRCLSKVVLGRVPIIKADKEGWMRPVSILSSSVKALSGMLSQVSPMLL